MFKAVLIAALAAATAVGLVIYIFGSSWNRPMQEISRAQAGTWQKDETDRPEH